MALNKQQKADQLAELKASMQKTQSLIFAHYTGLKVSQVSKLRSDLRKEKSEMKIAKKTLMQLAAKEIGWPEIPDEALDGPVACIFSFEDPLSGAQVAFKFSKKNPQVELIGGIFEGKLLSKKEAAALGQIPSKLALLSMFASMINNPLTSFARGLSELAKQKDVTSSEAEKPAPEAKKEEAPAAEAAPAAATAAPEPAATTDAPAPAADAPVEAAQTDTPAA